MKIIVVFMMAKYTGENLKPSYEIARRKPPRKKGGDGYGVCKLLKEEEKERIKRWRKKNRREVEGSTVW